MWVTLLCYNGLGEKEPARATAVKCPERPINAPEAISLGRFYRGAAPIITGLTAPKHTIELPGWSDTPYSLFNYPPQ